MLECNFCFKNFKTLTLLKRHQITTKYCLDIQEKQKLQEDKIICSFCFKKFISKQNLNNHSDICKIRFQNIITEKDKINDDLLEQIIIRDDKIKTLEETILELKTENKIYSKDHEFIKEIAKKPTITNNNNSNNKFLIMSPFNLTQSQINTIINDKFTKEYFLGGQKGVANFTSNNILKDKNGNLTYICTDASRNVFNFKTKEGEIEKDIKANKLTETISPAVITKSEKIFKQIRNIDIESDIEYLKTLKDIRKLKTDNDKFVNELSILTNNSSNLVIENNSEIEIIEERTDEEIDFLNNMKKKQEDEFNKLQSLKTHQNPNLYNYYKRKYIEKYGEI